MTTSAIPNRESDFDRPDGKYWIKVYETALERLAALRADRDILDAQLEELNKEIVRFEKVVSTLSPLASDGTRMATAVPTVEGIAALGLADACREILKQSPQHRTARGVRDSLVASGYNIGQHTNPLASIHGVLKRLAQSGDVEELEAEGKTRYRWKVKGAKLADLKNIGKSTIPTREQIVERQKQLQSQRKRALAILMSGETSEGEND